jgi:hypothetical protein
VDYILAGGRGVCDENAAREAVISMKLVLIHGRSQQQKDPKKLKAEWHGCIESGFKDAGFEWTQTMDVVFPFYGDDLDRGNWRGAQHRNRTFSGNDRGLQRPFQTSRQCA